MPAVRFEFLGFYAAESKEEHCEDQRRLHYSYGLVQYWTGLVHRFRKSIIYKINGRTCHHGDRKHPILYHFPESHMIAFVVQI